MVDVGIEGLAVDVVEWGDSVDGGSGRSWGLACHELNI